MGFCSSAVAFLYERAVALARKRQDTFGCFDPEPWFGTRGRVAGLIAGMVNKARMAEHDHGHSPCITLREIRKKILYNKCIEQ